MAVALGRKPISKLLCTFYVPQSQINYKKISEVVTKSIRKKFPQSWVFNILKRESSVPPNDEVIIHNINNAEL